MNELETFHHAGLIEIFATSTLPFEFENFKFGKEKARNYHVLGSNGYWQASSGTRPIAFWGTTSRESQFEIIASIVFESEYPQLNENSRLDVLHIDQAFQHNVDFFVTDEKKILKAASRLEFNGIRTRVCNAEKCLELIRSYFLHELGSLDTTVLADRLLSLPPILLGSYPVGEIAFIEQRTGEILLGFKPDPVGVAITCNLYSDDGIKDLSIVPNKETVHFRNGTILNMAPYPSILLLGNVTCLSFSIMKSSNPLMSARVLQNGKLLVYDLDLHSSTGASAIKVTGQDLVVDLSIIQISANG
ncbi:hypothetical protein [Chitinimonas sp. BJB300]|uniref:hypothetical protein n=1 Tax=Chitinimonas sp. BJB300 TaxID=1559339 RepID=UPI0011122972|nr:hypothetical protein [Chitinimonas sp. BJB300]TSJ88113.1 hypothetical protein FG002_011345 [Chitinimonas sp. BJB300]